MKNKIVGIGTTENQGPDSHLNGLFRATGSLIDETLKELVEDYREKGALVTIADAALDSIDLVADGLEFAACLIRSVLTGSSVAEDVSENQRVLGTSDGIHSQAVNVNITKTDFSFVTGYAQQNGNQFAGFFENGETSDTSDDEEKPEPQHQFAHFQETNGIYTGGYRKDHGVLIERSEKSHNKKQGRSEILIGHKDIQPPETLDMILQETFRPQGIHAQEEINSTDLIDVQL